MKILDKTIPMTSDFIFILILPWLYFGSDLCCYWKIVEIISVSKEINQKVKDLIAGDYSKFLDHKEVQKSPN